MINFEIRNGFTGDVQFTAQIDCDKGELHSVKIGLAVKWAIANRASLVGASLDGASLVGASLNQANLNGARLDGARLDGASLNGASLDGASLVGASLDRARLIGARLIGASLDRARLIGARLIGASLDGASLIGASLDGASFVGARLIGAKIGPHTIFRKVAQVRRDDGYEFIGFALDDGGLLIRAGCQTRLIADYRRHVASDYPDTPKAVETLAILDFIQARADAGKVAA